MKALIKKTEYQKEVKGKFGTLYSHAIYYDNKKAFYTSKSKDQTFFQNGKEAEFTEELRTYQKKDGSTGEFLVVKPERPQRQSNFGKALQKEQSRYSGFAESYVKDLLVAGIIHPENTEKDVEHNEVVITTWKKVAFEVFEHMVELDKTLEL
jgi:menaquinone-dependent protoporphyrinogen IX oxidase